VPLIELAIAPEVVDWVLDEPSPAGIDYYETVRRGVRAQHRLGYDVVKVSATLGVVIPRLQAGAEAGVDTERQWLDEHSGPIATLAEAEAYNWPGVDDVDFKPIEAAAEVLPAGMKIVAFCGGVLELAMDLIGMEKLMLATRRDPDLVAAVVERVGKLLESVFERYCTYDAIGALWLGDDLGHKHGTLLSPKWLIEHIVPWYGRFAEIAHRNGRPFMMHTCGNTAAVMDAIVEQGIDAKHSFEDGIEPVEQFYDRWHDQIAVLGGVDVHILATGGEDAIQQRAREILQHVRGRGGYALGSGNSIPNYVPGEHFVAMIETLRKEE
jgi:uroporphyrinogen decarboxylase